MPLDGDEWRWDGGGDEPLFTLSPLSGQSPHRKTCHRRWVVHMQRLGDTPDNAWVEAFCMIGECCLNVVVVTRPFVRAYLRGIQGDG